ncbi:AI-2E family transporter [Acidicapsa acidisoli]|uniref:AI-2E family transporter n=1 Tax=Acidicapsa acidisoli TaxID=1615681 RepID=UPI0021E07B27|nr:AI-2E family transporter [Acidicapsa acidisoli]
MHDVDDKFKSRVSFTLLAIAALALAVFLIWIGRVIFLLLFASAIGAILLTTVSNWLHSRFKIKQGLALALFLCVTFAVTALVVWSQGPNIVQQFADLETDLPVAAHSLLTQMRSQQWGQWILRQSPGSEQISSGFSFALTRIGGIVVSSATILAGLVIVFSLSIYFSAEPEMYYNGIRRAVPEEYRGKMDACAASVAQILRWWVLAKLISMTLVGALISIGLWIVGVPLAGTLGIIAAVMTFIPNVGPLISVIPAALLALAISPTKGLLALLVFAIVFTIEGYVVTPLLERNIVRLPPALTLTMQLLLAAVAGPVGVALAAPVAAAILGILSVLLPKAPDVPVPTSKRVA